MRTEFCWVHERLDNDDAPTAKGRHVVVEPPPRAAQRPRRLRWALWAGVLLALGAWVTVQTLARHSTQAARDDLAAVVQTEAQALAQGDGDLYRSLQAPAGGPAPTLALERFAAEQVMLAGLPDATAPRLLHFRLTGERADVWVGYTGDGTTYVRLQSYRRVGGRWLRSDPADALWGEARTLPTAHFVFRFHVAEEQVVGLLAQWAEALYANLDFGPERPAEPITVELRPYLAHPDLHTQPPVIAFTSPLLLGTNPVLLRQPPRLETLHGLAYAPGEGQAVLADLTALGRPVAEALAYSLARLLAGTAAGADLGAPEVYWPIVEAAARYAVAQQVPGLARNAGGARRQASLPEGRLLPLTVLWRRWVVVETQEACDNLQIAFQARRHANASGVAELPAPCSPGAGESFLKAVAQAESLIAFVAELMRGSPAGTPAEALPARVLAAAVSGVTPEEATWRLLQESAQGGDGIGSDPQGFVAAWQAWLQKSHRADG